MPQQQQERRTRELTLAYNAARREATRLAVLLRQVRGELDPRNGDLPPDLRGARPSVRDVYRILRDCGGEREFQAKHVHAEYEYRLNEFVGVTTVYHALTELCRLGLAVKTASGWRIQEPGRGKE